MHGFWRKARLAVSLAASLSCGAGSALLGLCGPFTDVSDALFCPFVLEIFTLGITTGSGASLTSYSPDENVSRLQMAAFLSRTVDATLLRGSRRAALGQFWTPREPDRLGRTFVGDFAEKVACDGSDVWVSHGTAVSRVRASDGKHLETWNGSFEALLTAMGRVFGVSGNPGKLIQIDPGQPVGAPTTVATLGAQPKGIAFDGGRIWTANYAPPASVSIVTPGATIPWSTTTVTAGFTGPAGILFDGSNMWVTDQNAGALLKLDTNGAVLQTLFFDFVGSATFDGDNIWVPTGINAVSVVRASTGALLATLTGNGMFYPGLAAFDGQRVLITNQADGGTLWKAADLTPLGSFRTGNGTYPSGVCSDGLNFWIVLSGEGELARF